MANAEDLTWTGGAGNSSSVWDHNQQNWQWYNTGTTSWEGIDFNDNDNVLFSLSGKEIRVTDLGIATGNMTVSNSNYTFSGEKISGNLLDLNYSAIFTNEIDFYSGIDLSGNSTITFNYAGVVGNDNRFISGGTVTKIGNGRLTLSADNVFGSHNIRVNVTNGELELTGSLNSSDNTTIDINSTLSINRATDTAFNGNLQGTGTFNKYGAGILTLNDTLTGTFGINIEGGGIILSSSSSFSGYNGTIDINDHNLTINNNSTFNGLLKGNKGGTFTKTGSSTLTMSQNDAIEGDFNIHISGGELDLRGINSDYYGNIQIDNNLRMGYGNTFDFLGTLSGGGNFYKEGAGTITLTKALQGNVHVEIEGGGLILTKIDSNYGGDIDINSSTLTLIDSNDSVLKERLDGNSGGTFNKEGAGTLTLLGGIYGAFDINLDGGELRLNNMNNTYSGNIDFKANTKLVMNGAGRFGGTLEGAGRLEKNGTGRLTMSHLGALGGTNPDFEEGINNFDILISQGELELYYSAFANYFGNIDITKNANLIMQHDTGTSATLSTYRGTITGSGTFTKTGDRILELTADNALKGSFTTVVEGGTLELDGTNIDYTGTINLANQSSEVRFNSAGNPITDENGDFVKNSYTFSGSISGVGITRKHELAELVLKGNYDNTTGQFIHEQGNVTIVKSKNNTYHWGGDYFQNPGTTLKLSGNSPSIGGNAEFRGIVDFAGTMTVGGDLTYANKNEPLNLLGNNKINVGGDFTLAQVSAIDFTIAEAKIIAEAVYVPANSINVDNASNLKFVNGEAYVENVIVSNNDFGDQKKNLDISFTYNNKLLKSFETIFKDGEAEASGIDYTGKFIMDIRVKSQTAEQYMKLNNYLKNQIEIARILSKDNDINRVFQELKTRAELEALINPFLVGELAVEANHLAMYKPYLKVFDHIANLSFHTNNTVILGQSPVPFSPFDEFAPPPIGIKAQSEFWSANYYTFEKVDDDPYAIDYETSQARTMIGYDKVVRHDLLAGFVLGYGNPHISNSVTKIKANDFLVGVYARKRFMRFANIYANVFLGYGYQDYQLSRNYKKTKYDGDSFYASMEFSRPVQIDDLVVEPIAAVDFQKTSSNGFDVDVNLSKANVKYTNILGLNQNKTLSIASNDFEQAFLRIGLNTSYKRLRSRFQYSYLAYGDATAKTQATIKGIPNGFGTLTAVKRGRYIINTGVGIDRNVGEFTKIFADYDFEVGKNINSHTGQLGIVTLF